MLTIPPGTQGGQRMKLTGKGFAKRSGRGARGNMYVTINIAVPKNLDDKVKSTIEKLDSAYGKNPRLEMMDESGGDA